MATNNSTGKRNDPLPVFCFKIELPEIKGLGVGEAFFKSVSGIRYETEIVPVREGGANDTTFQLLGATKWSNIVLKSGYTGSSALLEWRERWINMSEMTRVNGTIVQLNTALQPMAKWKFMNGWPCKWEISEFDASKSELAIETLEIAHEGIKAVKPGSAEDK